MNAILKYAKALYWAIYRLTPRGRRAWTFKKGYEGLLQSNSLRTQTKLRVIHSAGTVLKPKKIISFFGGRSISKSKVSNHQVKEVVKHRHAEELKERGIKITKKGRFKNA